MPMVAGGGVQLGFASELYHSIHGVVMLHPLQPLPYACSQAFRNSRVPQKVKHITAGAYVV